MSIIETLNWFLEPHMANDPVVALMVFDDLYVAPLWTFDQREVSA